MSSGISPAGGELSRTVGAGVFPAAAHAATKFGTIMVRV
jgi:hypothetical protein